MTKTSKNTKNNKSFRLNLDPVANAKTLGIIYFILGLPRLGIGILFRSLPFAWLGIISGLLFLIIGVGLIKQKLWALYVLLGQIVLSFGIDIYFAFQGEPLKLADFVDTGIYLVLFLWLYSAKKKFK